MHYGSQDKQRVNRSFFASQHIHMHAAISTKVSSQFKENKISFLGHIQKQEERVGALKLEVDRLQQELGWAPQYVWGRVDSSSL